MRRIIPVVMGLLVLLLVALTGCGGQAKNTQADNSKVPQDTSWATVAQRGALNVGGCPEYPPFSSRNEKGEIEGFDIDFANALGQALGVKVNFKDTAWEGLVAGLNKGDHDVIISCMSPEEAKAAGASVNLSEKYYDLNEIIVVKTGNEAIKAKEDLAGKTLGVQANCTSEAAADSLKDLGIVVKEIKKYDRNSEALVDLKNGRVEAVIVGFAYAATQVKNNADLEIVNNPVRSVPIVVVAKKGADGLTAKINGAIKTIRENGSYDAASNKWLKL